jgi:hypothetical protein
LRHSTRAAIIPQSLIPSLREFHMHQPSFEALMTSTMMMMTTTIALCYCAQCVCLENLVSHRRHACETSSHSQTIAVQPLRRNIANVVRLSTCFFLPSAGTLLIIPHCLCNHNHAQPSRQRHNKTWISSCMYLHAVMRKTHRVSSRHGSICTAST